MTRSREPLQVSAALLRRPSKARSAFTADILVQIIDRAGRLHHDLGVESGSWVIIERGHRTCAGQVIVDKCPDENGHDILISPLLMFYLRQPMTFIDRLEPMLVAIRYSSPPTMIAQYVSLHKIRSHRPQPSASAIQAFFRIHHVLADGFIVGIPRDPNDLLLYDDLQQSGLPSLPYLGTDDDDVGLPDSVDLAFYRVDCSDAAIFIVDESQTCIETHDSIESPAPYELSQYMSRASWVGASLSALDPRALQAISRAIQPFFHPLARQLDLQPKLLVIGARRSGKRTMLAQVAQDLGIDLAEVNCYSILGTTQQETARLLRNRLLELSSSAPVLVHLRRLSSLQLPDGDLGIVASELRKLVAGEHVVIVASSSESVPDVIYAAFHHEVILQAMDVDTRRDQFMSSATPCSHDLASDVIPATAGASIGDIRDLCSQLALGNDLGSAIASLQMRMTTAEGMAGTSASIPEVRWDDIGGLGDVKEAIMDVVDLPYQHAALFGEGAARRSGLLLYGPPGTGKTLVAKAVATECSLTFISVKGPELLNPYVGESEANVRSVFDRARRLRPSILFFDELDALVPNRGRAADSGGVMDRVVSQLLTELDGVEKQSDVFVIGATNRPDLIDSALLRPGRLDTCIYLGVCRDKSAQLKVVKALTRKFTLSGDVDLPNIVDDCPMTFTGADFYALCSDAMLNAIKTQIEQFNQWCRRRSRPINDRTSIRQSLELYLDQERVPMPVSQSDFIAARQGLTPSITEEELQRYESLKLQFEQSH